MDEKPKIINMNMNEQPQNFNVESAIQKYLKENDVNNLVFSTPAEASEEVKKINEKYGNISFVSEDRGGYAVKFRAEHVGEGFHEYKGESEAA